MEEALLLSHCRHREEGQLAATGQGAHCRRHGGWPALTLGHIALSSTGSQAHPFQPEDVENKVVNQAGTCSAPHLSSCSSLRLTSTPRSSSGRSSSWMDARSCEG